MKIKYRPYRDLTKPDVEYGKMPLLRVTLKKGQKTFPLECLVDSGAGASLFGKDIAHALGIDLKKLPSQTYDGIGNISIKGWLGTLDVKVEGFDEWITIQAGFVSNDDFPVLGHSGFFENYEITFRTYQHKFEIKRKPGRKSSPRPERSRN